MNTIRELKQQEKYNNMLKRKNKEIKRLNNVINELLKRIANLEREVERLEQNKDNTIKYCRNSNLTLKSHYFIDVINILEGAKYERY